MLKLKGNDSIFVSFAPVSMASVCEHAESNSKTEEIGVNEGSFLIKLHELIKEELTTSTPNSHVELRALSREPPLTSE